MYKKVTKSHFLVIVGSFCLLAGCSKKDAGQQTDTNADEVKEELSEAVEAAGDYLGDKSEATIDALTAEYTRLEEDTRQLMARIHESGQTQWQTLSSELERKLESMKLKLEALKESGKEGGRDAREAFETASKELKDAYQKAKSEFDSSE